MTTPPETEQIRPRTRLAPSPTGALHLGNARTFLVNWALARQGGWRIILRIEDLDTPRIKPGSVAETIALLNWLGMDWDEGPVVQSDDLEPYRAAMRRLAGAGRIYPCHLSRADIEAAASAPQEGVHETPYPASLRPERRPRSFKDDGANWRLVVEPEPVSFDDGFRGPVVVHPADEVGDFIVWTRRAQPSYQLAVVVDDHRQGVTHIVRGDDLLGSAGRQVMIMEALGLGPIPVYTHLPLVRGPDGRRLAKRHGDTRLTAYREAGVTAERVIGLIAWWCGLTTARGPMSADEFCDAFRTDRMSTQDIVFTAEDEAWLRDRP